MKIWKAMVLGTLVAFTGAMAQDIEVEEESNMPSFALSLKYASRYMSKAKVFDTRSVMQGDFSATWYGFTAGIWGNYDFTDDGSLGRWSDNQVEEWDYYLNYEYTIEDVPGLDDGITLGFGWIYYDYRHTGHRMGKSLRRGWGWTDDNEINASVSFGCLLSPTFTVNHEYEKDWTWCSFGGSYEYAINENLTWKLGGTFYWGSTKYIGYMDMAGDKPARKNALFSFVADTSLDYAINKNFSVGPFMQGGWILDHDYREAVLRSDNGSFSTFNFVWGFGANVNF
jgi:hypothetical protein